MHRLLALGMFLLTACSGGEPGPDTETGAETSTAPGLTITHLTEGSGPRPTATDVVRVHYHGTFPNGEVFDSSVERGKPARFPLDRVIPCWTEGLQQMQVGQLEIFLAAPVKPQDVLLGRFMGRMQLKAQGGWSPLRILSRTASAAALLHTFEKDSSCSRITPWIVRSPGWICQP